MPAILNLAEHARMAGLDDHCRHIAEILAEFDPELYIVQLPENHPWFTREKPFALVHQPPMREQRIVRTLMHNQVDERLVAELIQGISATRTPLEDWEALEKAQQISKMKREQEARAQRVDEFVTRANTLHHNHYAKHNGVYLDPRLRDA